MRRLPSFVFAALLALSVPLVASDGAAQAAGQPAPADKTAATVTRVQAFYDKTTSFVSDFKQEFFVKSHNLRKESSGTVTLVKPGKMNWEYANPAGNRVVSDGQTLQVYEAANKQMFVQTVDKSQYPAALAFLTGTGRLGEIFTFEMYPGAGMNFPGGDVLVGTPKQATPAYTKVLFYVDGASSQVRRVLIVDGQGNRNRFDFESPKVNIPTCPPGQPAPTCIPEDKFKFTPPPGTQIIKP